MPFSTLFFRFFGEGSPTKIDYRNKECTLILPSLLEDLDLVEDAQKRDFLPVLKVSEPSPSMFGLPCLASLLKVLKRLVSLVIAQGSVQWVFTRLGHLRSNPPPTCHVQSPKSLKAVLGGAVEYLTFGCFVKRQLLG